MFAFMGGTASVPSDESFGFVTRKKMGVGPIPNAALAGSDSPRTLLIRNYLVADFGVSSVERCAEVID
jgi:hypothetical protein